MQFQWTSAINIQVGVLMMTNQLISNLHTIMWSTTFQ